MRKTYRITSLFLAVVCLFAFSLFQPVYGLTELSRENRRFAAAAEELNSVWDNPNGNALGYSPLTGEIESERGEYSKDFRRADGAVERVIYSDPVHFEQNGEWQTIDNTLVAETDADGILRYKNTAGDFTVRFGENLSGEIVSVEYMGETLSVALNSLSFANLSNGLTAADFHAEIQNNSTDTTDLTDQQRDSLLRFPDCLSSIVRYVRSETDDSAILSYSLNGKTISEFITLSSRPSMAQSEDFCWSFNIKTSLTPRMQGNTVLLENGKGETVFTLPAPYMFDAAGAESTDFEVSLAPNSTSDGFIYTMVPSFAWLCSAERTYPVTIDPDIKLNFKNNVENTYVDKNLPNTICSINSTAPGALRLSSKQNILIRLNELPELNAGDVIVSAAINLTRYDEPGTNLGKEIDLYPVLSDWSEDTLTWTRYSALNNGNPADKSRVFSLAMSEVQNGVNFFDITDLFKKWHSGVTENYGVVLESSSSAIYHSSRTNVSSGVHPYFSIVYVNSTGLESRFSYSDQDAGAAGAGSVNLFSGNLTFSFADASVANGALPISVSHVYNTNDKNTDIGYGYGWRLNYSQSIEEMSFQNGNKAQTFFKLTDGDGTRHYYKKQSDSSAKYVNELDKNSTLTVNTGSNLITVSDKGGNKLVFEYGTYNGRKQGRLTSVEDANGNKILIEYRDSTQKNDLRISAVREKLASVSTSGQRIVFAYNSSNRLSSVTPPDGLTVAYSYSEYNNLRAAQYADGTSSQYTYYSKHLLQKAKNPAGYGITYTYSGSGKAASVVEKAGTAQTAGRQIRFEYGWNVTNVIDAQNRIVTYQFNNAGQAVSIRNPGGEAVFMAYNSADRTKTQLAAVSKTQTTVFNLLKNHGFDKKNPNDYWTKSSTSAVFTQTHAHTGYRSVKLPSGTYIEQSVSVNAGAVYTASAYFTGAAGGVVQVLNGSTVIAQSDPAQTFGTTGSDWTRGVAAFTVPTGVSSIKIRIAQPQSASGTAYADSVQLETGETPNRYNMLQNSDFTDGASSSDDSDNSTGYAQNVVGDTAIPNEIVSAAGDSSHPGAFSDQVLKITGSTGAIKHVFQSIHVNGKKGDVYSFGGWCASDSVPETVQLNTSDSPISYRVFGRKEIKLQFYSNGTFQNEVTAAFAADTTDWQYTCASAVASLDYTEVRIVVCFDYSRNTARFDGLQLHREQFSQSYSYDDNGNVTGYASLIGQEPKLTYDNSDNVTSSTDPLGNKTLYTYDSKHNLLTSTTPGGVKTTNVYDANGNVTKTSVASSDGSLSTSSTTAFNAASALASAVTDARGNTVHYGYNTATRQQTTVTDAKGNTSQYTYYSASGMLRLAAVTGSNYSTVNYSYDDYGKLTGITRPKTAYSFTYDDWGRTISTSVGNRVLSTNTYDSFGRLSSVTYGNGYKLSYTYDSIDRVESITELEMPGLSPSKVYEFVYDGEGNLYELRNYKTRRSTFFEYDHVGRCMASNEKSFTGGSSGSLEYTAVCASYKYEYDKNNNLSKLTQSVMGFDWAVSYTYDKDNRPLAATLANGAKIINQYDGIGRLVGRSIKNGSATVSQIQLSYVTGTNGATTLVRSYRNGSDAKYNYGYDANGNITKIWRGDSTFENADEKFSYEYDSMNQLVRENLYYGENNSANSTYTYAYDSYGNMLGKYHYAYTTGSIANKLGITVAEYQYTDSQWGDLLTAVTDGTVSTGSKQNNTVSYDEMGNPTRYFGAAMTWAGKQLKYLGKSGKYVNFAYNEDGIRTQKNADGILTNYYYNGSLLIGMTVGSGSSAKILRFSYDASGNAVAVDYSTDNGSTFNTYYYLRNAQNDIVKLIDNSGSTVVEYCYDSWGKLLSTSGSLASTLGKNNPFRYRGYVYDEETGFYYLQSRYYNPEVGRFISADVLLSTGQGVIGHNAYAYCGNNPIVREDTQGNLWGLIAAAVGAVVGVVSKVVTDVVSSVALTGEVHLSSWQDYVGEAVGGATEAVLIAHGTPPTAAAAIGSGLSTLVGEGLSKITKNDYEKSWAEIGLDTLKDVACGAALCGASEKLPTIKLKGLNAGRNSYSSVFKSGMTKLKNGTARRMSLKVFGKGLAVELFNGIGGTILDIHAEIIEGRKSCRLYSYL